MRLLASLLLIGGLTMTTGCFLGGGGGSNNGNNGDGQNCASGEISFNGQCLTECGSQDDCQDGQSCTPLQGRSESVCVGTGNGGDAGTDTTDDAGTDAGDDGGTSTGTDTCAEVLSCAQTCQNQSCLDNCLSNGTEQAQSDFNAYLSCAQGGGNCDSQLAACLDCSSDEVIIGTQCASGCSDASECDSGEICDEPILQPGESVCSHDMSSLDDACSGNGDCAAPDSEDVVQGQAQCVQEDQNGDPIPGGTCIAFGCALNGQRVAYGPSTGCGLDAFCLAQQTQQGTIGVCLGLCRETADCPRGAPDYTCSIFQQDSSGKLGTCGQACASNDDCSRTDQQGNQIQGRCNDDNYCEQPCDPNDASDCTDAGGSCESDGDGNSFCVFN